ncbi:hypothetical protein MA03_07495 [Infirmifilum uzonense]|uniref:UDP-N-acetylglucosamine--dolichyl-phosphate N-acetylglucosaminephosphotransferase n=1 Tax=Infirmifilum uzonense TaxID=1550241 RepID=A0A0F7FI95_9CREN|nr:hypothetical protein [Infirmifilum uzonense]AKG39114.1 hypothetical protein MA03_07495 [Infirmifilum uzonense]
MELYLAVLAFSTSLILTALLAEPLIKLLRRMGIVRPDAHKPGNPTVAHSGGVILFLGVTSSLLTTILLAGPSTPLSLKILIMLASGATCFAVGLVDDVKILRGGVKTVLTLLGILPVLVAGVQAPQLIEWGRPVLPLIGRLRITIIYWALMPLSIAGAANIVNMLDVMNGVIPGTSIIAFSALAVASLILGREATLIASLAVLGALIAYYKYNAYPARVFNGDSGSLFLGALIGAIAVVDHMEFIALTLLLPHLLNGFFVLVSFRGFKEHRQIRKRPIQVDNNGILTASTDPDAPLSLTRVILAVGGPSREPEVAKAYILLEAVAAALALVSAWLMR